MAITLFHKDRHQIVPCFVLSVVINTFYYIAGFVGILLIVYFIYDLHAPFLTVYGYQVLNKDKTAVAGKKLLVSFDTVATRICPVKVSRYVWGDCGLHELKGFEGYMPGSAGDRINRRILIDIPDTLESGECYYHATIRYYCNPLSYVVPTRVDLPDVPFKVIHGNLQ